MATTKRRRGRVGRPPGSGVKGHVQTLLQLRPDQRTTLLELAKRRAPHAAVAPVSEVAREALDLGLALLAKGGRKP